MEMELEERRNSYEQIVREMRKVFLTGKTREIKFRKQQLKRLQDLVEENYNEISEALIKDMRKPRFEIMLLEYVLLKRDIKHVIKNFEKWAKPTIKPRNLTNLPDKFIVHHDPFGVVLIIAPWNFLNLAFSPLVGAIAAGNCAIIKPSEVSSNCEALIAKLVPQYMDKDCFKVVTGGPNEITSLLREKFDYIFYTGSFNIAQIIHTAANKYLTPVTLELGGKSPTYVDDSVNFRMTAQRILWGKFSNLGQICVAPDYILCSKSVEIKLIKEFKIVLYEFYGTNWQESKDLARIINLRHLNRLQTMLKQSKGDIVIGGEIDEYDLWIAPTIIVNVEPSDSLMESEIFGPLLPILTVNSAQEAISFINERGRPLALYVYTRKSEVVKLFKKSTHSGALDINDCMYHCSVFEIPFGGVGESGMGRYHGKYSFDSFSYDRAIIERTFEPFGNLHSMMPRYPPYTKWKHDFFQNALKYFDYFYIDPLQYFPHVFCFIVGILVTFCFMYFKVYETIMG